MEELNNKKYGKTINNRQCITPCYSANTWILHPTSVQFVKDLKHPYCATDIYYTKHNGVSMRNLTDVCEKVSEEVLNPDKITKDIYAPISGFDSSIFLSKFYKINSIDEAIKYINENDSIENDTKDRILNLSFECFKMEEIINSADLIEYYISILKKRWIKNLYKHLYKFIEVDGDKIKFKNIDEKENYEENKVEKINFIVVKLITYKNIQLIIKKFIEKIKNEEGNSLIIFNYQERFLSFIIDELNNIVLKTIEK
jgi:hypothetical protein